MTNIPDIPRSPKQNRHFTCTHFSWAWMLMSTEPLQQIFYLFALWEEILGKRKGEETHRSPTEITEPPLDLKAHHFRQLLVRINTKHKNIPWLSHLGVAGLVFFFFRAFTYSLPSNPLKNSCVEHVPEPDKGVSNALLFITFHSTMCHGRLLGTHIDSYIYLLHTHTLFLTEFTFVHNVLETACLQKSCVETSACTQHQKATFRKSCVLGWMQPQPNWQGG